MEPKVTLEDLKVALAVKPVVADNGEAMFIYERPGRFQVRVGSGFLETGATLHQSIRVTVVRREQSGAKSYTIKSFRWAALIHKSPAAVLKLVGYLTLLFRKTHDYKCPTHKADLLFNSFWKNNQPHREFFSCPEKGCKTVFGVKNLIKPVIGLQLITPPE